MATAENGTDFEHYFPDCDEQDDAVLEAIIRTRGCVDPIETWRGDIVDGNRRKRICDKFGIEYSMVELPAEWSIGEVRLYIEMKQYSRRQTTGAAKKAAIATLHSKLTSGDESCLFSRLGDGRPTKVVAEIAGVSEGTVYRAVKSQALVERLPEKIREQHESGKCELTEKQMHKVLDNEHLGEIERTLRVGQAETTDEAFLKATGKPLRKKRGPKAKDDKPDPSPVEEASAEEPEDEPEVPVEDRMETANKAIESACRYLMKVFKQLTEPLAASNAWIEDKGRLGTAESSVRSALATLRTCKGDSVCNKCEGDGCRVDGESCKLCRGTGWLDKATAMQSG